MDGKGPSAPHHVAIEIEDERRAMAIANQQALLTQSPGQSSVVGGDGAGSSSPGTHIQYHAHAHTGSSPQQAVRQHSQGGHGLPYNSLGGHPVPSSVTLPPNHKGEIVDVPEMGVNWLPVPPTYAILVSSYSTPIMIAALLQRHGFFLSLIPFIVAVALHATDLLRIGLIVSEGIVGFNLLVTFTAWLDGRQTYFPHAIDLTLLTVFAVLLGINFSDTWGSEDMAPWFTLILCGALCLGLLMSVVIRRPGMMGYAMPVPPNSPPRPDMRAAYHLTLFWAALFFVMACLQLITALDQTSLKAAHGHNAVAVIEYVVIFCLVLLGLAGTHMYPHNSLWALVLTHHKHKGRAFYGERPKDALSVLPTEPATAQPVVLEEGLAPVTHTGVN